MYMGIPSQDESQPPPTEPRILELDSEAADTAFDALTASGTRTVLSIIYEQPSTSIEISDKTSMSAQVVRDHLGKLEDADLIEPARVGYAEKGSEMTLYAPANEAVMLVTGRKPVYQRLREFIQ